MGITMKKTAALAALALGLLATTAAAGNPHAEKTRLKKADMALAKRIGLRRSDLSASWTASSPLPYNGDSKCPGYDPDFSRFTISGRLNTAFNRTAAQRVDSSVQVFPSVAQSRADFRLGVRGAAAFRHCLAQGVIQGLERTGLNVTGLKTGQTAVRGLGERSVVFSVSARLHASGRTIPLYADLVSFQRGRVQVGLMFTTLGTRLRDRLAAARAVDRRIPR
jgi:hypothetical protein